MRRVVCPNFWHRVGLPFPPLPKVISPPKCVISKFRFFHRALCSLPPNQGRLFPVRDRFSLASFPPSNLSFVPETAFAAHGTSFFPGLISHCAAFLHCLWLPFSFSDFPNPGLLHSNDVWSLFFAPHHPVPFSLPLFFALYPFSGFFAV